MKPITKIELDGYEYNVALCCEYDGALFHIWLDSKTFKPSSEKLYKNPIAKRGEPDYFETRVLDQRVGVGRQIVPAMLAEVPKLIDGFRAKLAMDDAHQKALWEDDKRERALRNAARDLRDALKYLLTCESSLWHVCKEKAEKALAKSESWKAVE